MTEIEKHHDQQSEPFAPSPEPGDDTTARRVGSDDGDTAAEAADKLADAGRNSRGGSGGGSRSGLLVWLALVLALAAIALSSYPFWSAWQKPVSPGPTGPSSSEFETLAGRVEALRDDSEAAAADLRSEIERLAAKIDAGLRGPSSDELVDRIDQLSIRLERSQGERNTALSGLRSRLADLESEVGRRLEQFDLKLSNTGRNLDQANNDTASRLQLMGIDSLFAIAQDHLAVTANAAAARKAWVRATERLAGLEGAEFERLKAASRRELRVLRAYNPPDTEAWVQRLFQIADEVVQWPPKNAQPADPPADQPAEPEANEGWRERMGRIFGKLVTIESVDREFVGPAEIDRARERVRTALRAAALALLRHHPALASRLVNEAEKVAREAFDPDSARVKNALDWLENFSKDADSPEPPMLTESRAEISRLLGELR